MRALWLFLLTLTIINTAYSQSVHDVEGVVQDSTGMPVQSVSISLLSGRDTMSVLTNVNGAFLFEKVSAPEFRIRTLYLGASAVTPLFTIDSNHQGIFRVGTIVLKTISNQLAEITITADPVVVKEDTIEYKASAFKVREGAMVEDVIKKLPGITVDGKGGITAQGKEVTRVRVNGKDFFGGDVTTATKNLPADAIDNIQVIDDYGEQAKYTKIKTGEPEKVININTKKSKTRGLFGNVSAGAGTNDRYQLNASVNSFDNEQQLSFIGGANNTGAGGQKGSFGSQGENGLNTNQSAGMNFRNKWYKKLALNGSYNFNRRESITEGTMFRQDFNPMNTRLTDQNTTGNNQSISHNVQASVEYELDSMNNFTFTPNLNYSTSGSANSNRSKISRPGFFTDNTGTTNGNSDNMTAGARFFFNHKFRKPGRNLTLNASIDHGSNDQRRSVDNLYYNVDSAGIDTLSPLPVFSTSRQRQVITDDNNNTQTSASISYIEPVARKMFLEGTINWNRNASRNDHVVHDIDSLSNEQVLNPAQTNLYRYNFTTTRYGLNFKKVEEKYNYVIGIVMQPSDLEGHAEGKEINTSYRFVNWMPNARLVYKVAPGNTITVSYNGSSREPGFTQLQPVVDSSNLTSIVIGNPDLKAEFSSRINLTYNIFNKASGTTFFAFVTLDETQNKIVNNVFNAVNGTGTTTTYRNVDGFYRAYGNASFTKPFAKKKYNLTVSSNVTYSNNIAFTDNQRNNGFTWNFRPSARFAADITDVIDAEFSASYNSGMTVTRYAGSSVETRTQTLSLGITGKNYFLKDWTLGYDFSKNFNYGFGSSVQANPNLLHLYLEYRFLKHKTGTLRLQAFDVFNQNTGINRSVNGTTVTDSRNNRLGRYFLLVFNLRLRQFYGAPEK